MIHLYLKWSSILKSKTVTETDRDQFHDYKEWGPGKTKQWVRNDCKPSNQTKTNTTSRMAAHICKANTWEALAVQGHPWPHIENLPPKKQPKTIK